MADGSITIDTLINSAGLKKGLLSIANIAKSSLKVVAGAIGTVTTAFAGLVTASVKARGKMEQTVGGTKKIFDEMDYAKIEEDAKQAYKTMNLSAKQYLDMMNSVGATFASTMGDERGYNTAKIGLQAIADYASGTGADINNLNEKYKLITRSTTSYLSIADQFSGILPQTTDGFLKQAQASGYLSQEYEKLNQVPVAEYQEAIAKMLEKGVGDMGLLGNTVAETEHTLTGSISAMKASWDNFLTGTGDLKTVVDNANNVFNNVLKIAKEAVPSIIDNIVSSLPEIIELGGEILMKLGTGIIENLPKIIEITFQIIQTLITTLIENLPTIVEMGFTMIAELISGIAEALPTLIPQVVECVLTIVETLLDNIDLLIDAGIELIIALAEGLIDALPILIEKAPEIIQKLLEAIARNLPKIIEAGYKLIITLVKGLVKALPQLGNAVGEINKAILNGLGTIIKEMVNFGGRIVQGIWQGIQNDWNWLVGKVKDFAKNILDGMKSALGIHSPSRLFKEQVGKNIALGVGEGFEDNISRVYKQMKSAVDFETQRLSANLSTTANYNRTFTSNVNINGSVEMDGNKVGRLVAPSVSRTLSTAGA